MATIFEQPLNERIRTLLRLELLFDQLHFLHEDSESIWHNRGLVVTLIEILNVFERADIKTEFFKELDRLKIQLTKLFKSPNVDGQRLQEFIKQLDTQTETLQAIKGRIGQSLRENELITAIKHRLPIPGGTCEFDLPQYHYWLHKNEAQRKQEIVHWINTFKPVEESTRLILELIRNSAYKEKQLASSGFFQKALDNATPCQLIQVKSHDSHVFPEISGGKHRINIRFLQIDSNGHPTQAEKDVEFDLICCMI